MAKIDETYHKLCKNILTNGRKYEDLNRKNVYRIQIPHYSFVHDFKNGFPAITTKKLYWKGVVAELLWFLRGDTNIKYLVDNGVNIWNKDAYNYYCKRYNTTPNNSKKDGFFTLDEFILTIKNKTKNHPVLGNLGRVYGSQWRDFRYIANVNMPGFDDSHYVGLDQISSLINNMKTNPLSTQHIVTAWNPAELDNMALPPCHWSFEILVEPLSMQEEANLNPVLNDFLKHNISGEEWERNANVSNIPRYKFTLKWHQRSVDTFLGLPFNISSYALLAHIIGKMTNMIPKAIIGDLSNVHIYENHLDAVKEQLNRNIDKHGKSELNVDMMNRINMDKSVDHIVNMAQISDFELLNYTSYPSIKAEMLAYNK